MEALIFLFNGLVLLALVASSLLNDRRPPGKPLVGPFRYEEEEGASAAAAETAPAPAPGPPRGDAAAAGWRGRAKNRA